MYKPAEVMVAVSLTSCPLLLGGHNSKLDCETRSALKSDSKSSLVELFCLASINNKIKLNS